MKHILKFIMVFALVFGIVSSVQTNQASAAVKDGFYVNHSFDISTTQFIQYSTTEKVNYLLNKNAYLVFGGEVIEAKLIVTASDSTIEEETMSTTQYEQKFGTALPGADPGASEKVFEVIGIE